ncbi:CHRD domain-containing protein [Neolewinella litorea]|uniref:CHRD domain-containing protein n=1 Tax=Neolewinella litorea TaxID=2562452 RepID=A0A4S4NNX4_9BACT|nr:CHRD domain-containing protein [Neolewinella litorea]THH41716.1 CHRD domain-containing protein [Neolewinella litorea]
MRTLLPYFLSLLLSFLFATVLPAQDILTATARLSGQQEVLPVATAASGTATLTFEEMDNEDLRVTVSGSFENLSSPVATEIGGGAHIHLAYPGRNGGVLQPLAISLSADSLSGTFKAEANTFVFSVEDIEDVDFGGAYINIHTRNYPAGELRGIVIQDGVEAYYANLLGSNEVPSVISTAHGAVLLLYDASENSLTVTGSYDGLMDTLATAIAGGAHLHLGLPGANGPVNIPLTATEDENRRGGIFASEDNTFTLTTEQLVALREGRFYANIHSGAFRSGEIRGQVLPQADVLLRAHLAGANEWPVVTSDGSGQVLGHLSGNTLRVVGSFKDLESPVATDIAGGAHLHTGWAGENGSVIIPLGLSLTADSLGGSFPLSSNVYTLTDEQRTQLIDRGIYLNIHSADHRSGEIRGQMLPESQAVFTAFLNGNQQIPAILSPGRGMVKVEMNGSRLIATGSFRDLESDLNTAIAGGSHLHAGYPGQSGPVVYSLTATQDDGNTSGRYLPNDNRFQLTGGRTDTLIDRFFYVNVHTLDHPGGEIRGSVLAEAESYFLAPLSGASEPQGVPTDATGMVVAEVRDSSLVLIGSFEGLDSDFASSIAGGMHLHRAIAGSNGGIVTPVNTEIDDDNRGGEIVADSNRVQLSAEQYGALRDRELYANVHSTDYPSGAIRGQLLPLALNYFHTTFSGVNEPGYVATTAQGGLKLELIDSTLMVSGSVTMLDGDFDASVAGGAHLHVGPAGQNGGIAIPLNADPADDLKSATFSVSDNTFRLTETQLNDLRRGWLYANIHTTEVASGEARGQILAELNRPPLASEILQPADSASLELSGPANQEFRVTYASTTDPDADTVIYVWQLATDAEFTDVIFGANTGRDTFFVTDFGTVDVLLDSSSVAVGDSVTLFHRVLASDGSNYRPSAGTVVTLTRGDLVGTRLYVPDGFAARTFPNPVRIGQQLYYELATREAFSGRLFIYSQLGQLQAERNIRVAQGQERFLLETSTLAPGQYFLTLRHANGSLIHTARFIAQ